jgi:hypothetical protein
MPCNLTRLTAVALMCLFLVGPAVAGPLPTDPNAMPGFQGQQFFSSTANGFTMTATVEFAVYAPGMVETSAALGNPGFAMDPSLGANWVYAYEVFNTSPATGGAVITASTVGLNIGPIPGSASISNYALAGGVAPTLSHFAGTTSATWSFGPLNIGANSDILFFTMPYSPTYRPGGVQGGHGTIASESLPSPTPEPATISLLASALLLIGGHRFLRRRCRLR